MTHSYEEAGVSVLQHTTDLLGTQWGLGAFSESLDAIESTREQDQIAMSPEQHHGDRRAAPLFTLDEPKGKSDFKKKLIACVTFWFGSKPLVKAGKRQTHNVLRYAAENTDGSKRFGDFILGCILFNAQHQLKPSDEDFDYTYDGLMLERERNPQLYRAGGTKVIIQVFEEIEQSVPLSMGSDITAFPKQDTPGFVVLRFPLVDFSYDPHPSKKQKDDFVRLFDYLQNDLSEIEWIYVHCKAGVNRSFKVSSALIATLDVLRKHCSGEVITEEVLFATVRDVCAEIKCKRTCVEFQEEKDKDVFQIAFVSGLVRAALESKRVMVKQEGNSVKIKQHNYLLATLHAVQRRISSYLSLRDINNQKRQAATLLRTVVTQKLFDFLPSFANKHHATDLRDLFSEQADTKAKRVRSAVSSGRLSGLYSQVMLLLDGAGISFRREHMLLNIDLCQYGAAMSQPSGAEVCVDHGAESSALFHTESTTCSAQAATEKEDDGDARSSQVVA